MAFQGKFFDNVAMTGNFSSVAKRFILQSGLSIHSVVTGTPVGTLYFEGSNDPTDDATLVEETTWVPLTPYTEDITGADNIMTWVESVKCKWFRMRYDDTSSTGFITSYYFTTERVQ